MLTKRIIPVSVIMPVSKEPLAWVKLAIESILEQTFPNFELILIIDQPDRVDLIALIRSYADLDSRIGVVENERNLGLPASLNAGIRLSKGRYIARMDSDDIAMPERLNKQFQFMEQHKEVSLCGAHIIKIDEQGKIIGEGHSGANYKLLKKMAAHINIVTHPTWMLRREVFQTIGYYRAIWAEDYDFVLRMLSKNLKITNIDQPLLYYRVRSNSYTNTQSLEQKIGFKYTQQLYRERIKTGRDNYDESYLRQRIETMRKEHGQQQHKAQALLLKAKRKEAKGKTFQKSIFIFFSMLASPVQRKYYLDWARAYLIKQSYPANERLNEVFQPITKIFQRDKSV